MEDVTLERPCLLIFFYKSINPVAPLGELLGNQIRLKPIGKLTMVQGVAHSLMENDTYKGWSIPAGSIVVTNQW